MSRTDAWGNILPEKPSPTGEILSSEELVDVIGLAREILRMPVKKTKQQSDKIRRAGSYVPKLVRFALRQEQLRSAVESAYAARLASKEKLPDELLKLVQFAEALTRMRATERIPKFRPITLDEVEVVNRLGEIFARRLDEIIGLLRLEMELKQEAETESSPEESPLPSPMASHADASSPFLLPEGAVATIGEGNHAMGCPQGR